MHEITPSGQIRFRTLVLVLGLGSAAFVPEGALRAQERTPPAVLELPPLALPEGTPRPPRQQLEATIVVDPHGSARLEQTAATEPLRSLMKEALGRGRFVPARVDGKAVSSRVRLRFGVRAPPSRSLSTSRGQSEAGGPPDSSPVGDAAQVSAAEPPGNEGQILEARARVAPSPPTAKRVGLDEIRDTPGTLGEPFRVLETLPGVVPVASGVPFVYVRGAPPAGTVFSYDGVEVPALFHLFLGSQVIHPRMLGDVTFYLGVPPARYGRRVGGVLRGDTRDPVAGGGIHGELELRVLDVNGMVELPVLGGQLQVAGHYGYPGMLLSLTNSAASVDYWDYQTRFVLPIGDGDTLQILGFGSSDVSGSRGPNAAPWRVVMEFHRLAARLIRRRTKFEFGSELRLGYDHSALNLAEVRAMRVGWRTWWSLQGPGRMRLRVGADMFGSSGRIVEDDGEIARERFLNQLYTGVAGRNMSGAYVELKLPVGARLELEAGLRADLWLTGTQVQKALEPRAVARLQLAEDLELHAAAGVAHQLAVFPLPLPGVSDAALDSGLQRALQAELGAAWSLGEQLRLEAQVYANSFSNVILPSLLIENADRCDTFGILGDLNLVTDTDFCQDREGLPRASSRAYGVELFVKRPPTHKLAGWLSYTLGKATARAPNGMKLTPQFDIRHVLNWVVRYRFGHGWKASGRLFVRSGRMASALLIERKEQRLPAFVRADAQLSYAWRTSFGRMRLSLEFINLAGSREPLGIDCNDRPRLGVEGPDAPPCKVNYAPRIMLPNLGLRGSW